MNFYGAPIIIDAHSTYAKVSALPQHYVMGACVAGMPPLRKKMFFL